MLKFNEDNHEYTLDDRVLISTTQLMAKHHLSPDYSMVKASVLQNKAERGTLIHAEIEDFNKNKALGFTDELSMYVDYIRKNKITVLESEYMVNNDLVAGTIDLVLMDDKQFIIADIKTTSSLHKDSVSWQLSIYTYLYWLDRVGEENLLENYNNTLGQAYHFGKSGLKVVDIHLRPLEEVLRLIECERQGIPYTQPNIIPVDQLVLLEDAELEVARLEALVKAASQKRDEFRQGILKAMEENGIINYESDLLKISYIAPSVRTTIDSAKLKKDLPDLAKEYSKEVKSNASVRITIKGDNNE